MCVGNEKGRRNEAAPCGRVSGVGWSGAPMAPTLHMASVAKPAAAALCGGGPVTPLLTVLVPLLPRLLPSPSSCGASAGTCRVDQTGPILGVSPGTRRIVG